MIIENKAVIRRLGSQVRSFAIVGLIGFVVDGLVLSVLSLIAGINVYLSRLISFTLASLATWLLNRRLTFKLRGGLPRTSLTNEYIRYAIVQIGGALVNLGVFAWLVHSTPVLKAVPIAPLAIGAGAALIFNFLGTRIWVYRDWRAPDND